MYPPCESVPRPEQEEYRRRMASETENRRSIRLGFQIIATVALIILLFKPITELPNDSANDRTWDIVYLVVLIVGIIANVISMIVGIRKNRAEERRYSPSGG